MASSTQSEPKALPKAAGPSKWRITALLSALFLSLFVAALDSTVVATAVPVMAHELGSGLGYTWIGGSFLLASSIASPIWGILSDIWGRKPVLLVAITIFFVSSIICAVAKNIITLIVGRALQGVSGVGLILLTYVVISDVFSMRRRSLFLGLSQCVWAVAGGIGPIIGGIFASLTSWRWCFWINLPISGIAFVLIFFSLDVKHTKTDFIEGMRAIDWLGIFTFTAATLMILLGLEFGGEIFPWNSPKVVVLIVVGCLMIFAFIYSEMKAKLPLLPMSIFINPSNLATLLVSLSHGLTFMSIEYYLPLYFQAVKEDTPIQSGLHVLALALSTAITSVTAGLLMHRTGRFRELIWAGTLILCLGSGLLIMLDESSSTVTAVGLQVLFGVGSGLLFEPPLIAIQAHVSPRDITSATSTIAFVRSSALALSVIINGIIFSTSMSHQSSFLAASGIPASTLELLSGNEAAANVMITQTMTDPTLILAVKKAFAHGIRDMFIASTAFSGLGLVAGWFVKHAELSKVHIETVTGLKGTEKREEGPRIDLEA
ncbi:uncharacterized protein K452DRAFT_347552 [Aplosporella prunicola CBS 121167]|uniref:Major facilitator superfamily (MFS) profile domain-containing protein n=1 Tax=Aplosporella prunicola CBS 121167 TaxID=1176127 RepID=A0A6A6AV71_9PEZI|nr:uncharacterized protein K452DRAFT_347552 [Aplosporella prunicola CBS 121167]KAF2135570.1 hypothetical protein K452DRAFT_347552 [Aplosporella prunicola CBS 121167]